MTSLAGEIRPARKLLRAVADLHTRGYQQLRVAPFQYDLGTWRCSVAPAAWISDRHGAVAAASVRYADMANYSSAEGSDYWGWVDKNHCTPGHLASIFLDTFPALAKQGYGQDWLYAGWFQHMLHLTYPDALPVTSGPYLEPMTDHIGTIGRSTRIPLPPAGLANDPHSG